MTYKEAREYLQPVADSTPLAGYGAALSKAIEALEKVEDLSVKLEDAISDLKFASGHSCAYCKHFDGDDHCTAEEPCFPNDNWEWKGFFEKEAVAKNAASVLTARYNYPENGYEISRRFAAENLEVGKEYEVSDISMGQSHTSVFLVGKVGCFNSVNFDFYENGKEIDIFKSPKYNYYLETEG